MVCVLVAVIGFIGTPYSVSENDSTATLTVGVINGSLDVSVSLSIQLQDISTIGTYILVQLIASPAVIIRDMDMKPCFCFCTVRNSMIQQIAF